MVRSAGNSSNDSQDVQEEVYDVEVELDGCQVGVVQRVRELALSDD